MAVDDRQSEIDCDTERLSRMIRDTLAIGGVECGEVSLAIVSDSVIRQMNARFLGRDETTDVIAFTYEKAKNGRFLEGEVVVNASEAVRSSSKLRHGPGAELLLYAVHGALHLLGWEDCAPCGRNAMNRRGVEILAGHGVKIDDSTLLEEG